MDTHSIDPRSCPSTYANFSSKGEDPLTLHSHPVSESFLPLGARSFLRSSLVVVPPSQCPPASQSASYLSCAGRPSRCLVPHPPLPPGRLPPSGFQPQKLVAEMTYGTVASYNLLGADRRERAADVAQVAQEVVWGLGRESKVQLTSVALPLHPKMK